MIPEAGIDLLRQTCDVKVNLEDRPLTRPELLENVRGQQGVIGLLTDRIDADFLDAAEGIKGYSNYAVGFDNIDIQEATKRKVPVSNTPDVPTDATAEMAWAALDVYEFEPEVAEGLVALDNVVTTAHTVSATVSSRTKMSLLAAQNHLAMMNGERSPTCLNPEVYE